MTTLTSQNKRSIYKQCSTFLQEVICSICRVIIQEALKHSTTKTKTLLIYKLSSYNIRQHHEEARLFQNGIHNVALNCCLTRYNIQTNIGINWSISIQRNVKGFCLVIRQREHYEYNFIILQLFQGIGPHLSFCTVT